MPYDRAHANSIISEIPGPSGGSLLSALDSFDGLRTSLASRKREAERLIFKDALMAITGLLYDMVSMHDPKSACRLRAILEGAIVEVDPLLGFKPAEWDDHGATVVIDSRGNEPGDWRLVFLRTSSAERFECRVLPAQTRLADWRGLVAGRGGVPGTCVRANDEYVTFGLPDRELTYTLPLPAVAPQLIRALDAAVAAGLPFADAK